jgi:hypothetical protein
MLGGVEREGNIVGELGVEDDLTLEVGRSDGTLEGNELGAKEGDELPLGYIELTTVGSSDGNSEGSSDGRRLGSAQTCTSASDKCATTDWLILTSLPTTTSPASPITFITVGDNNCPV